eukprot:comp69186_c0_seq1/m.48088 comp69186_c0_seq1/g.48088  ORF comp69186_c0_seq1/g.48088 comp69186_c0_seq1/m.48088 type:complete len:402 (-) comp69186_c0_seq1:323-1528(-)
MRLRPRNARETPSAFKSCNNSGHIASWSEEETQSAGGFVQTCKGDEKPTTQNAPAGRKIARAIRRRAQPSSDLTQASSDFIPATLDRSPNSNQSLASLEGTDSGESEEERKEITSSSNHETHTHTVSVGARKLRKHSHSSEWTPHIMTRRSQSRTLPALPSEMLLLIFEHLAKTAPREVLKLRAVCRWFRDLVDCRPVMSVWDTEGAKITLASMHAGALRVVKRAADCGNASAAHFYGMHQLYVVSTPDATCEGVRYMSQAAQTGHMPSYFSLAILTHNSDAPCLDPIRHLIQQGQYVPLVEWEAKEKLEVTKKIAITSVNAVIRAHNTVNPPPGKIPTRHVVARHLLPVPSQCSHEACGRKETAGLKLKVCSRCYGRKFCSRFCQITKWQTHKTECTPAQ